MFRSSLTILIVFGSISSGHAQFLNPLQRHRVGRIIAGCIIGGLAIISFLVGFCLLARRRRARATTEFSGQTRPYSTGWPSAPYQGHQMFPPPPQYTPTHHEGYGWSGPEGPKYPINPHPYPYVESPYPNQPSYYVSVHDKDVIFPLNSNILLQPPAVPPSAHTQPGNF